MPDTEILAAFDAFFDRLRVDRDATAATALFADDADIWMSGSDVPELAIGTEAIADLHRDVVSRPFSAPASPQESGVAGCTRAPQNPIVSR